METDLFQLINDGRNEEFGYIIECIISQCEESETDIGAVINRRNSLKYTLLHAAIFERNLFAIEKLLEIGCDVNIKCHGTPSMHLLAYSCALSSPDSRWDEIFARIFANADFTLRDDQGSSIMHVISELNLKSLYDEICKLKSENDIMTLIESKDRLGNRPLHKAVSTNSIEMVKALLDSKALKSSPNNMNETPLHLAVSYQSKACWDLLLQYGVNPNEHKDRYGRTPLDCCHEYNWDPTSESNTYITTTAPTTGPTTADTTNANTNNKKIDIIQTAIISHPLCLKHSTCAPSLLESLNAPPENAKRLSVLVDPKSGILHSPTLQSHLLWKQSTPASISDVLRVHEWTYIRKIHSTCMTLSDDDEGIRGIGHLDGDTAISKQSFTAALHAAGAVCNGIDEVIHGHVKNSFCAIRPPGHHAGPRGVVPGPIGGSESHGFCLLNNSSIGAAYALNVHRDVVKRVAIVDFDVHHGNGTEETVRYLRPTLESYDVLNPLAFGTMYTPIYKPWYDQQDSSNVLFVSVHGFGARERGLEYLLPRTAFYPGTGKTVFPKDHLLDPNAQYGTNATSSTIDSTTIKVEDHNLNSKQNDDVETMEIQDDNEEDEDKQAIHKNGSSNNDGEEDDEEDDDDDDYHGDGDEDDDEDDEDDTISDDNDNEQNNEERKTIAALKQIYSNYTLFRSTYAHHIQQSSQVDSGKMTQMTEPLILDIGVSLPPEMSDVDDNGLSYRYSWRNYYRNEIFPRLLKFQPDMIIVSAGFDGHKKDVINGGYLSLLEEDFDWVTYRLVQIAYTCCNGRIVSSLEGGYQIHGEFYSSFARSVKAHVQALIRGSLTQEKYSADREEIDAEYEVKHVEETITRRYNKSNIAHQKSQMLKGNLEVHSSSSSSNTVPILSAEEASDSNGPRGKRRRAEVNYADLDKELSKEIK